MPGFFMIDIDDFDEIWSIRQNKELFIVYAALSRKAWRQDKPRNVIEGNYQITISQNQFILHIRQIALSLDLAESTLRDRIKKLEAMEAIRIDEPVPNIKIVTVMKAYSYRDHGERIPCSYRAPSVVNLRIGRDRAEGDPSQEHSKAQCCNIISQPKTSRLEDLRCEDIENQDIPLSEESIDYIDEEAWGSRSDEAGSSFDEELEKLTDSICSEMPDLTPVQAREWAMADLRGDRSPCSPE